MSKTRPSRNAAVQSKARISALAQENELSDDDSSGEGAGASTSAGAGAGAAGGSKRVRVDSDEEEEYRGDSPDDGEDSEAQKCESGEDDEDIFELSSDEDEDDSDDDDVSSRPGYVVSEEEKSTIANIKEKLMIPPEQTTFIKDLTKGLAAFVICNKRTSPSMQDKVDLLSRVSFHKEELSEESRTLICQQTVSAMQNVDMSKIKEESHKTFYDLASYRRTRIVAGMISDVDTVLAGILVLQLSLAQVSAGRVMGETFAPGAIEEQTVLIEHLLSLPPLEGVAQICAMVILNTQHVQRRKIKTHQQSTRVLQLFDKAPIVRGMATMAQKVGLFFVRVRVGFEGNMQQDGCPAVTRIYGEEYRHSGIVSVLPAQHVPYGYQEHSSYPFKMTL